MYVHLAMCAQFLGSVEVSSISGQECTDAAVRIISRSVRQKVLRLIECSENSGKKYFATQLVPSAGILHRDGVLLY